jgi:RNA polymerase-binding transcription factor DksA
MEDAERAQLAEMRDREEALARIAARAAAHGPGKPNCVDCGAAVAASRMAAGAQRCVPCQETEDRLQQRLYGRRP